MKHHYKRKVDSLYNKFCQSFEEIVRLAKCEASPVCVVGWSGGADSTCLIMFLSQFFKDMGWDLAALHGVYVNHGWRDEAVSEAETLRQWAEQLGISFHVVSIDKAVYAAGGNLEEIARKERYRLLWHIAQDVSSTFLLVGHQKNDQIEGVVKRLCEGSSLQNLSGMDILRAEGAVGYLARPLLHISREEIERWLHQSELVYFEDPTNSSEKFTRSRLRHAFLPALERHFGKNIQDPIERVAKEASSLKEFSLRMRNLLYDVEYFKYGLIVQVKKGTPQEMAFDAFVVEQVVHSLKAHQFFLSSLSRCQVEGIRDTFIGSSTEEKMFEVSVGTVCVRRGMLLCIACRLSDTVSPDVKIAPSKRTPDQRETCQEKDWRALLEDLCLEVEIPIESESDTCIVAPLTDARRRGNSYTVLCPFSTLRRAIPSIWTSSGRLLYSPFVQGNWKAFGSILSYRISMRR